MGFEKCRLNCSTCSLLKWLATLSLLLLTPVSYGDPPNNLLKLDFCGTEFALIAGWEVPEPSQVQLRANQFERLQRAAALAPRRPARVSNEARATTRFELDQAQKLDPDQIRNLTPLDSSVNLGYGYHAIARGSVDGRSVFVKVSGLRADGLRSRVRVLPNGLESLPRDVATFKNEVAWVKRLSDLGAGPKFEGVTVFGPRSPHPNHFAVVTRYFPGTHLNHTMVDRFGDPGFFPTGFKPTPELFKSLEHLKTVIRSEGLSSIDLQLRINSQKAVIVDPEFIGPATLQSDVADLELQIDQIIIGLKSLAGR